MANFQIGSFPTTKTFNWPAANIEAGTKYGAMHFPSGLWSLFHILSVSTSPTRQNPYSIMEGIYAVVEGFFR